MANETIGLDQVLILVQKSIGDLRKYNKIKTI